MGNGKYRIGARVRDWAGDEGVITDKRTGERLVKYDEIGYGSVWWLKRNLTPIETKSSTPTVAPATEWVPKVGDRVRNIGETGYAMSFPIGGTGIVAEATSGGCSVKSDLDGWVGYFYPNEIEPVVASATTDTRPDAGGGFKAGDRIRLISDPLPMMPIGSEFVAVERAGGVETSVHFTDHDGAITWRPGAYFELVQPLTIKAGKSYKTRDGRKVGPIQPNTNGLAGFPWEDSEDIFSCWRDDGTFGLKVGEEHPSDLIAEWPDEPVLAVEAVEPAAELPATTGEMAVTSRFGFTIGDHVQPKADDASWVDDHYASHFEERYGKSDGTYFVREFTGAEVGISAKNEGGAACFFWPSRFEPVLAKTRFKVGDKVRVVGSDYEFKRSHIGREFVIHGHCGELDGEDTWNGDVGSASKPYRWKESELELVTAPAQAASTPTPATPTESFIVARLTSSGLPRPNARPRVHTTLDSANTEAQRLADQLGDEFAVYQRVDVRSVDAGAVPESFDIDAAKLSLTSRRALGGAFIWECTPQRHDFWQAQSDHGLTPLGRAILRKWIAQSSTTTTQAA